MPFLLPFLARYAAKKIAFNPRAREKAAEVARQIGSEAKQIAGEDDPARAAGRALRRAKNKIQGDPGNSDSD